MNRRDFLKTTAGAGLYLAARKLFPEGAGAYDVGIVKSTDYERAVTEAIALVGGIREYVKPGDIVVVKPNIAFNRPASLKATTDPVIVRTVVHLCFQAQASKVLGRRGEPHS